VSSRADVKSEADRFVKSYARLWTYSPDFKTIPHWPVEFAWRLDGLCIGVEGLTPDQDAAVRARVAGVVEAAGLHALKATCGPAQIDILFSPEPQRLLDGLVARAPQILGDSDSDTRSVRTVTRPIQAWYSVGPQCRTDGECGDVEGRYRFLNRVTVIVDLRRTGNRPLKQLADYAAMLALSEPRSLDQCQALPSVTDMFAGVCPDRGAVTGLTAADEAYLSAIYKIPPDLSDREIPSEIVGRMARILAGGGLDSAWASAGDLRPNSHIHTDFQHLDSQAKLDR